MVRTVSGPAGRAAQLGSGRPVRGGGVAPLRPARGEAQHGPRRRMPAGRSRKARRKLSA